jgi:hypothetical protein
MHDVSGLKHFSFSRCIEFYSNLRIQQEVRNRSADQRSTINRSTVKQLMIDNAADAEQQTTDNRLQTTDNE